MSSQQKLAEKLTILNDRGIGMLTRIYNIKKMLSNNESKPSFLADKSLEPVLKSIMKKFPNIDIRQTSSHVSSVNSLKADIIKSLSLYYYTFVDILDFKDHVVDLLTTIDACQVNLNISLCYDLTKGYLDLIATYVAIMIMVSRVDDRKGVLGLFNFAYELIHGNIESSFPRLGQMILDYEMPIKKMSEEFIPHQTCVLKALMSLFMVYPRRNLKAENWRSAQMLSLICEPAKIMNVAQSETMPCEYLSLDTIERWIIFGFMVCPAPLLEPSRYQEAYDMWKMALHGGYVHVLCRDEVLQTHDYLIKFFSENKNAKKRVEEIKEFYHAAVQQSPVVHRDRRKFLRNALKELAIIFADQPGLLGPKGLYLFMALSFARDEIHWLLRHSENQPSGSRKVKVIPEDYVDRQLPELLFHMEELRALVKKYNQVMQRYYVQYLAGYDAIELNNIVQSLSACPEEESIILSSFYNKLTSLSVKQVEEAEIFDFRDIRMDWFRLQAYTSLGKAGLSLTDHANLAQHMNTVIFHTKMADFLDELLNETSDLSIYCFYTSLFEHQFRQVLEFPAQHRYSIAFPMICSHFMSATHELCPEERQSIGTTCVQYAHWFLKEMAEEVNQVITAICEEHVQMQDRLLPKHSAVLISNFVKRSGGKKDRDRKKQIQEIEPPGKESQRKSREELTRMDKLHMALTELCYATNYCSVITVWEHGFVPREFFTQHLEARFNKMLVGMMMYNPGTEEIAKPSELLNSVKAVMNVLQSIENYIHIDIARVFNNVLPQQTQPNDSFNGEKTITSNYTTWYLEVLLRRVSLGHCIYAPAQKAFISITNDPQNPFSAEEFADIMELRALAELIGPYGMKYMGEKVMHHIAGQVEELKRLVVQNKDTLTQLRTNFDNPEEMKELYKRLENVDKLLQRLTIIGVLLSFRGLAQEALQQVLDDRIPFLMSSIRDFQHHVPSGHDAMIVTEMASAAGLSCSVDPALCGAIRAQKSETGENEYNTACLLMVFIAVSMQKLARNDLAIYRASFEGHMNNIHCLAKAINSLAGALFTIYAPGDIEERLKEFLALTSQSLLRLGQENNEKEVQVLKNRDSIYLLLDLIVQESPFLTMDLLESCFPYALLRNAYHAVYKNAPSEQP
ncbi:unnamed protein product [Owenia fusiformis]|uniref:Membrane-associated protein Hem n=1 Tax=Owenia fusiformis TaxID=6347 RepID=A0A8S4NWZ0_OWEFU|nr:unnamed protein product [Owenia fusiformis]